MSVFTDMPCIARNDLAFAIWDKFPMSEHHALLITEREVASWFDATPAEQAALMELAARVKREIERVCNPNGYRLMINVGSRQHIPHLHVHLIPSYAETP